MPKKTLWVSQGPGVPDRDIYRLVLLGKDVPAFLNQPTHSASLEFLPVDILPVRRHCATSCFQLCSWTCRRVAVVPFTNLGVPVESDSEPLLWSGLMVVFTLRLRQRRGLQPAAQNYSTPHTNVKSRCRRKWCCRHRRPAHWRQRW